MGTTKREFVIGSRPIGQGHPPLVIAEMSGNHNQSLERALAIVEAAAKAGAHALKLQTYTADTMTIDVQDGEFRISDPGSLWAGNSLYALYKQAHTPWEWHEAIFRRAAALGMVAFSTPFDETSVDFLESLNVPCYKIASFENTDLPLIRKVASTGKPVIMSTGMATLAELDESVRAAKESGCRDLILLKCTSTYPADPLDTNLNVIPHLRELFDCEVGLSDHTMGIGVAIAAIALGASMVEKHFTLARVDGGVDSAFSIEPMELAALVEETHRVWRAMGSVKYGPTSAEKKSMAFRRSLYVVEEMEPGEPFTTRNLKAIRPGYGLPPRYYETLIGRVAKTKIRRGTPMSWDLIG